MTEILFEKHAPITAFEVRDDVLVVGGQSITELYRHGGGVPLYLYDRDALARRVADLKRLFDGHVDLHYAMKANPMPELVRFAAGHVDGLDVASGRELDVALTTTCPPSEISFAGPAPSTPASHSTSRARSSSHASARSRPAGSGARTSRCGSTRISSSRPPA